MLVVFAPGRAHADSKVLVDAILTIGSNNRGGSL